ncbi:MAG: hypothetical protein ACN6OD_19380, partial [Alcaligenes sp.]
MNEAFLLAAGTTFAAALIAMAYSAPRVFLSFGKLLWALGGAAAGGVLGMYVSALQYAPKFGFLILETPSPCINDDCRLLWDAVTKGKAAHDSSMAEAYWVLLGTVGYVAFLAVCTVIAIRARRVEPAAFPIPRSSSEATCGRSDEEKRSTNKLIAAMRRRDRRAERLKRLATAPSADDRPAAAK